ncbi:lipopolysaccharide heptosyltransferase II [bacterium]|nr:MAG: lipopolysaccharide heptosyltransferase II [bacterium]RIK60450.1 MAG: lipopolysaccharide heptosyltransferase II [Planctomycetota bacterium]
MIPSMVDDLLQCRNVVVRAPNALGDLIMATPAFARLAAHYTPEHVSLICLPAGVSLLQGNDWFRELIAYDRAGSHRGFGGGRRFVKEIRARSFDLGIILPNSFGSAWQMMRAGVKNRVGYFKEGRGWLLHAGRPREHDAQGRFVPKYTGQYFMDLLDVIGLPRTPLVPRLPVSENERSGAAEFLARQGLNRGPLVILAPGAAFGPSKLWPPERFAQVADALASQGAAVLVSYGPGEEDTLNALQAAARAPLVTTQGMSLGVLKAVYAQAALVISNDTGPRHLAVALGRPVLTLMGPNDPRYSALPQVERGEVIRVEVDCAPYTQPCQLKECPIDHRCMKGIEVTRVLEAARRWLS